MLVSGWELMSMRRCGEAPPASKERVGRRASAGEEMCGKRRPSEATLRRKNPKPVKTKSAGQTNRTADGWGIRVKRWVPGECCHFICQRMTSS
jgi:hypothetical protein